jgi:PIN domain nuclease of toxin-antitoxin system
VGQSQEILLDTHLVVWLAFDQAYLMKKARQAIGEARERGSGLTIPTSVCWC